MKVRLARASRVIAGRIDADANLLARHKRPRDAFDDDGSSPRTRHNLHRSAGAGPNLVDAEANGQAYEDLGGTLGFSTLLLVTVFSCQTQ